MRESQATQGLILRWVPVVDARGRTHMEARWTRASGPVATGAPAHAA
jgi:hypothetical protein